MALIVRLCRSWEPHHATLSSTGFWAGAAGWAAAGAGAPPATSRLAITRIHAVPGQARLDMAAPLTFCEA